MNVVDWLRGLGLERYIRAFEDHDVDEQTLPMLTEADLVEIGVKSVGHRRRLVDAIAALEGLGSCRPLRQQPLCRAMPSIAS